jgi:hypothetical protein
VPDDGTDSCLRCRRCAKPITRREEAIVFAGGHQHTFANPLGVVFQIGLFAGAPGCRPIGSYSEEFTWFAGHRWCIVLCAGCREHLGWHFADRSGGGFHGLILERLAEGG